VVWFLSVVISVRVPRRLKEEMDKLGGDVNWSEEIRRFLEERVRELRRKRVLEEAREGYREAPGGLTRHCSRVCEGGP